MGVNAILLCKNIITKVVEHIHSINNSVCIVDTSSPGSVENPMFGVDTRTRVSFSGLNLSTVQNVLTGLWQGPTTLYVFPLVGQQMRIVSTSASDAAAGTGVRTVHIHYLDSNYVEHEELIVLNGTSPVNTVGTDIFRINFMHAITTGTTTFSVGTISLTNTAGTITYNVIGANATTSRNGIFTVPAGKTLYITHWNASSGSALGTHFTRVLLTAGQHLQDVWPDVLLVQREVGTLNNGISVVEIVPIKVQEKVSLTLVAISDAINANVTAMGTVGGYLQNN